MNAESGFKDLLRELRDDTTTLVRDEINLAKTEIGEKAKFAARNVALLVIAGLLGFCALLLLLTGVGFWLTDVFVSQGMEAGIAAFLAFLVVAILAAVACGGLAAKARAAFSAESVAPTRTARSLREDKQWAQNKVS